MVTELRTSGPAVQLTISGFMFGMAFGQMLGGSLSDAWGRRRLLLAGEATCLLATVACATAPTIEVLIAARTAQGVSGAFGVAIARAIVIDVASGPRMARIIATLMAIVGITPIVGPIVGSVLATIWNWRAVFWLIAATLAVNYVIIVKSVPETLPREQRRAATVRGVLDSIIDVLSRRRYVGYLLAFVFAFAAFFAYVAAAPFITQVVHDLSPIWYGAAFSSGAVVMTTSFAVSARLAGRVDPERLLHVGLRGLVVAGAVMLAGSLAGMPLWVFFLGILILVISMGQAIPNGTVQVLEQARDAGGTASAILGFTQFLLAAAVAPLVSLAGTDDPRPFGVTMAAGALLALAVFRALARRPRPGQA